jgi:hypothetical protein
MVTVADGGALLFWNLLYKQVAAVDLVAVCYEL